MVNTGLPLSTSPWRRQAAPPGGRRHSQHGGGGQGWGVGGEGGGAWLEGCCREVVLRGGWSGNIPILLRPTQIQSMSFVTDKILPFPFLTCPNLWDEMIKILLLDFSRSSMSRNALWYSCKVTIDWDFQGCSRPRFELATSWSSVPLSNNYTMGNPLPFKGE